MTGIKSPEGSEKNKSRSAFGDCCRFDGLFKVSNTFSDVVSEISDATRKVIDAAFHQCQSLLCRESFVVLLRRQTTNEMVLFCVLPGTSFERRNAL